MAASCRDRCWKHPSTAASTSTSPLLPKYRGSAPVQWAVLNGDAETGVSIMQMDEGLDTGDVLVCEKMAIDPEETSGELFDRVTAAGARVLCETIPGSRQGP